VPPRNPEEKPGIGGPLIQARVKYRRNPSPEYPEDARRRNQEGVVLVKVVVNARGRVDTLELEHSSGYASLDEAALKAVRRWEFDPARRGGAAVVSTVTVPVRFRLE